MLRALRRPTALVASNKTPPHTFPHWGDLTCSQQLYERMLTILKRDYPTQLLGAESQVPCDDVISAMIAVDDKARLEKKGAALTLGDLRQMLSDFVYIENTDDHDEQDRFQRFLRLVKEQDKPWKGKEPVDPNAHFMTRWSKNPNVPPCPAWTDVGPTANVVRGALSLDRFQTTGSCSLLSIIVAHYLEGLKIAPPGSDPDVGETIDATEYVRRHVRGRALQNYLNQGSGFEYDDIAKAIFDEPGAAESFVPGGNLTLHDLPIVITSFKLVESGLFHHGMNGPYVASNPEVFFFDKTKEKGKKIDTSEAVPGTGTTLHSMLIVGMQDLPNNGGRLFLVKNWWPEVPYAVVDEAYLAASNAQLATPSKPKQLSAFETVTSAVATTQADAAPKSMAPV